MANGKLGDIMGAIFATISGKTPWGETVVSQEMIYVMTGMSTFYLSQDCTINLGIIHLSYPQLCNVNHGVVGVLGDAMEQRDGGEQGEPQPCSKMKYVSHDYSGPVP